jgi:hypothetical protein
LLLRLFLFLAGLLFLFDLLLITQHLIDDFLCIFSGFKQFAGFVLQQLRPAVCIAIMVIQFKR